MRSEGESILGGAAKGGDDGRKLSCVLAPGGQTQEPFPGDGDHEILQRMGQWLTQRGMEPFLAAA